MTVTLTFKNTTWNEDHVLEVNREACDPIARWYGAYHGGDDYTVEIDGELQAIDLNGQLPTDPTYSGAKASSMGASQPDNS